MKYLVLYGRMGVLLIGAVMYLVHIYTFTLLLWLSGGTKNFLLIFLLLLLSSAFRCGLFF